MIPQRAHLPGNFASRVGLTMQYLRGRQSSVPQLAILRIKINISSSGSVIKLGTRNNRSHFIRHHVLLCISFTGDLAPIPPSHRRTTGSTQ